MERLTSKDLMIGDWVIWNSDEKPMKICANSLLDVSDLSPIPITSEILKKNGFKYHPLFNESKEEEPRYAFFFPRRDYRSGEDCIILSPQEDWNKDYKWGIDVEIMGHTYLTHELNYVHEMQQLLRLCKINKEIEL